MMEYGGNKMLIEKSYNVKSLAETLDGALSVALDDGKIVVEIGLLEASEIKEILDYVAISEGISEGEIKGKREQKHQTLCDDCLMSGYCTVDCTNEHITEQMLGDLKKCFGKSYIKRPYIICGLCKYAKYCKVLTKHE